MSTGAADRLRAAAPPHLPVGALAPVLAGAVAAMEDEDWVFPGPREHVAAVLRGLAPEELAGSTRVRVARPVAAPGRRALHAVGAALATGRPALCLLGLASAASGAFHEALNVAALHGAPVVFVVVVQPLGEGAPIGPQIAARPRDVTAAWGLHAADAAPEEEAVRAAVAEARARAPALVEVRLVRPG